MPLSTDLFVPMEEMRRQMLKRHRSAEKANRTKKTTTTSSGRTTRTGTVWDVYCSDDRVYFVRFNVVVRLQLGSNGWFDGCESGNDDYRTIWSAEHATLRVQPTSDVARGEFSALQRMTFEDFCANRCEAGAFTRSLGTYDFDRATGTNFIQLRHRASGRVIVLQDDHASC